MTSSLWKCILYFVQLAKSIYSRRAQGQNSNFLFQTLITRIVQVSRNLVATNSYSKCMGGQSADQMLKNWQPIELQLAPPLSPSHPLSCPPPDFLWEMWVGLNISRQDKQVICKAAKSKIKGDLGFSLEAKLTSKLYGNFADSLK